ncbi:TonB-dependent receptor [Oxalicibacterium flavum]|uniref:TonB-dependent receptor n=1 Tax=Oxalicibacterium flavum TaxID=179467 RepID=A0A8J2UM03_9BURK|nr:TonB-dependent receptor [Oxalicibacterium flavum]GGC15708.1 TonB-dependent receptor [Oxalicibacterium flavum]
MPTLSVLSQAVVFACLSMGLATMPSASQAQQTGQAAQSLRQYQIPAGTLDQALNAFATQAGILISIDGTHTEGKRSAGLSGQYGVQEGLDQLLKGSGLEAVLRADGSYGLERQARAEANALSTAEQSWIDATVLAPIIIRGEKFARSPFNTFTSVEFVTSDELDDYVRQSLDEALNSSPNIRMFENSGNTNIAIRGMNAEGATQPSRSNPVISVSVDGAEQGIEATRRGTRGVWDVEQIEVLRGPQSTLQGRNALAGSVAIKTKDPTFKPEAIFRQEIDSDGLYSGAFAVSAPIIEDQLAFRLSGQVARDDKDISYSDPKWASQGDEEFEEFRGKLLFTPSALPGFTGLFTVSRTHDKPAYNTVTGPDFFAREYVTAGFEEFRDTTVSRYIADLKYEFNPDWTIQSVTSYVDTKVKINAPRSATFFRDDTRDREDFSQDIRLIYGSEESAFSGVLGLYAGYASGHSVGDSEMDVFGLGYTVPLQRINSRDKSTSLAVYADGRYEFTDRWTLLAGGRLLHDKVSANVTGVVLAGTIDATLDEVSSVSNTEFLPKIGLAFEISENQNIALTASKGYRPGFSEHILGTTTINTVESETLWAYELAYRSKWLDDRLQINGNVFYYDHSNMQVPVPVPDPILSAGYTYTINAGQAESYGAEIEARWNLDSGLDVYAGLGLLKTKFKDGVYNGASITGNEFPEAPALTASLGAIYKRQSGWFVGGDVSFTDGYYSKGEVANRPVTAVDSFTIVNAQAGYQTRNFTFSAYAKNLLNEKYLTGISSNGNSANIGDAWCFGLQLTQRF